MTSACLALLVLQSRGAAFSVLSLLVILALGVILLYRRQTTRMRLRWRLLLLTLRLAAISAMVLSMLQPMSVRHAHPREQGAVVIVVDHSHSMATRDYEGHPDQTVALADGLGMLKPDIRSRGDEWVALAAQLNQCAGELSDAQSALAFARISGRSTSDAETQVAQTTLRFDSAVQTLMSRRPALSAKSSLAKAIDQFKQVLQLPRNLEGSDISDTGEDWLPSVRTSLSTVASAAATFQLESDQALYRSNPQVKEICDSLAQLDRLGLVELAMTQPRSGLLANLSQKIPLYGFAAGDQLASLPLRGPPLGKGAPVRHLFLDTDSLGMNLTETLRTAIQRLAGIPIRSIVLFSSGRQPPDQSFHFDDATIAPPVFAICAAAPHEAHSRSEPQLSIGPLIFPSTVVAGELFTVSARAQGADDPAATRQEFSCQVDAVDALPAQSVLLTGAGSNVTFQLHIDQLGAHKISVGTSGARGPERWIHVIDRPTRVALEAREPVWDWRFARDNLNQNTAFAVRADTFADEPIPLTPQDILQEDAIILFGAQRQSLDVSQLKHIDQFVRERGGLLVFLGAIGRDANSLTQSPAIRELLPMNIPTPVGDAGSDKSESAASSGWQVWPGSEPDYSVIPSPQAKAIWPASANWKSLPGIYRFYEAEPLKPAAEPLLIETNSKSVVAAQMSFGAGHVVFIGLDELWRWRAANPDATNWFWPTLLRHFIGPPYAATDGCLSVDAPASIVTGRPLDIRLKYIDASGSPANASITIAMTPEPSKVVLDAPKPVRAGEWTMALSPLPPGTYQIQATSDDLKDRHSVSLPLRVLPEFKAEYQNTVAGQDTLARLAETSHGRLLLLDQVRQLPGLLDQAALTPTVAVSLWDSGYLFAFVVACLCAEWALRKRIGLA